MDFKISVSSILGPARTCASIAEAKRPLLKYMKITARFDKGIILEAVGAATTFRVFLDNAEVIKEGCVLIDGSKLASILQNTESNFIHCVEKEKNTLLNIYTNSGRYSLATVSPEGYPRIEPFGDVPDEECFIMSFADYRNIFSKTYWAAAKESGRFALNGVHWSFLDKKLSFVATDQHRMSIFARELLGCELEGPLSYTVPIVGMKTAESLMAVGQQAKVRFTDRKFYFKLDDYAEVTSSLVSGGYPPWRDVLHTMYFDSDNMTINISASDFSKKLDQASLMNSKETNQIYFTFEKDLITLSSSVENTGSTEIRYSCVFDYKGEPFTMRYNPRYFRDALGKFSSDSVSFTFSKDESIAATLHEENGLLHIIMPCQ